jgi:DNA polymerase III epsilon subunit-like protein
MSGKLVNFKESKLESWRSLLSAAAREYGNIYIFIDTETTGTSTFDDNLAQYHRVLEFSCVFTYRDRDGFCHVIKDQRGSPVCIDEPMNPFVDADSSKSAIAKKSVNKLSEDNIRVHGLSIPFLFGEEEGPAPFRRSQLKHPAPSYTQVFDAFSKLISFDGYMDDNIDIYGVFHNAPFDLRFLNQESDIFQKHIFESFFCSIDTQVAAKKILPKRLVKLKDSSKASYSLDRCYEAVLDMHPDVVNAVDRPIHTALIDSMITLEMFNGLNAEINRLRRA